MTGQDWTFPCWEATPGFVVIIGCLLLCLGLGYLVEAYRRGL